MTQTFEIKDAEKQVFRLATLEDGIWEIYLGIFFLLMSAYELTREILGPVWNAILFLGLSLLLAFTAVAAKKGIIQPRTGLVKFGPRTQKKIKTANLIVLALVVATLTLMILGANALIQDPVWKQLPQWISDYSIDLLFAGITIGIFSLAAYSTGVARFYLHGFLLGVGNFATTVLRAYQGIKFGWPLALAGLMIAGIGTFVLARFLKKHSLPKEEIHDGR
jgi:hypothetical protein